MKRFDINEQDLNNIVSKLGISSDQKQELLTCLESFSYTKVQKFTATNVLRYLGGMMALMAFGYFFSVAWMIHPAIFLMMLVSVGSLIYYLGYKWSNEKPITSRLLTLVSFGAFSGSVWTHFHLQGWLDYSSSHYGSMMDFHRWISGGWFYFECVLLLLAVVMFYRTKVALLTMPIALITWYMGMDIADLIGYHSFQSKSHITTIFAITLLTIGLWADIRNREKVNTVDDYGFWFTFFGAISFTGSISFLGNNSMIGFLLYFILHAVMMVFGAFWRRKVFTVVGGIALFAIVSEKFIKIFGWPSIALLGLATLFLADYVSKHQHKWMPVMFSYLPKTLVDTIKLRQEHV